MDQSDNKASVNNWRISTWFPDLTPDQGETLRVFYLELLKFNPKINLISRKTEIEADLVHFADSILASRMLLSTDKAGHIFDIGSGNGFPGLVLATLAPERKVTLVDKDTRKIEFMKHAAGRMGLKNVETFSGLFEDIPPDSIECGISRGFASLTGAIIAGRKPFKVGGRYYHMKSNVWASEVTGIPTQLCSIWAPKLLGTYNLPKTSISLALVLTEKKA